MAEASEKPNMRLGVFETLGNRVRFTSGETVALGLAGLWALLALVYLLAAAGPDVGPDPLRRLMAALVIFLPAGLVWLGVIVRQNARAVESQAEALQRAMDQFRKSEAERSQRSVVGVRPAGTQPKMPAPKPDRAYSTPVAAAPAPGPGIAVEAEPVAGLFEDAEAPPPVSVETLIRALHFPETSDDQAGFDALRAALRHHPSGKAIRSAQDVLTLMSQDGIYMDDLIPDRAKPEVWRRFAQGERGRTVSELGGIRDRAALALSARRMREEPIFRDAAHHFLRSFDQTLARIEPEATDAEIARLSETRSARAFMLLGRVSGLFT